MEYIYLVSGKSETTGEVTNTILKAFHTWANAKSYALDIMEETEDFNYSDYSIIKVEIDD